MSKHRFLKLYIFFSSLLLSTGVFYKCAIFMEHLFGSEPRIIHGLSGNTAFYNFNNEFKLILFVSSLLFVPVFTLGGYYLWAYLSRCMSGGSTRQEISMQRIIGIPYSISYFIIPAFFGAGMSALESIISIALLMFIFWIYQFGYGSRSRFEVYMHVLFVAGFMAMILGFLMDKPIRMFMSPFLFIYTFAAVAFFPKKIGVIAKEIYEKAPDFLRRISVRYHGIMLFYGFTIGAFLSINYFYIGLTSILFWIFMLVISSMGKNVKSSDIDSSVYLNLLSFSPLILLYLKAPLYIAIFCRFSSGAKMSFFLFVSLILVSVLILVLHLHLRRTGPHVKSDVIYLVAGSILIYSFFFNPAIDGRFDYYHEAEHAARASLFMNTELTFRDAYFFEHGLIQDFGIGWAAFKIFGESLEGLRLFKMFFSPLGVVVFFIVSFFFIRRKGIVFLAFLLTLIVPTQRPFMDILFSTRFIPSGISLIFLMQFIRKERPFYLLASAFFAFTTFLWSLDVGMMVFATEIIILAALDFKNNRVNFSRYRALPVYFGAQAVIFLLFYFIINKDIILTTLDVMSAQSMTIQLYAHALPYPKLEGINFRDFYFAYINPAILIFSVLFILLNLLAGKWDDEDFVFLTLTVFSAGFFIRAFGRSGIEHLLFASPYMTIVLVLAIQRAVKFQVRRRLTYYMPLVIAAFIISFMPLYGKTFRFIYEYPYKKLIYQKEDQGLKTDKIGNVLIDRFQVAGINTIIDFFEKEGKGENKIFDFTNNYGISIWLLNKRPITKALLTVFYNTSAEQDYIVEQLKKNHPRFILINSNDWYSKFDGFCNSVRYPIVSRYIFNNYIPYARALNFNIMADRGYAGKEKYTSRKIVTIVDKDISGVINYGFAGTDIPLPPSINNYRNRYIAVVMSVKGEGTNEYYKDKDIYLINKIRVASVYTDDLTPYQFKLKNSDEFVEYIIPIPDRGITSLKLVPANFRCMFTIRKIAAFSSSGSQYPNTLREWDMFEKTELGYIPYFMGKESRMQEDKTKSLLNHEFERSGNAELNDIGIKTEKVSRMIIDIESAFEKDAVVMWDAGFGYFDDQAVYFRLKNDGRPHRYLIDLSSVASWHYIKHVKNLKISSSSGDKGFRIKKLILFS